MARKLRVVEAIVWRARAARAHHIALDKLAARTDIGAHEKSMGSNQITRDWRWLVDFIDENTEARE